MKKLDIKKILAALSNKKTLNAISTIALGAGFVAQAIGAVVDGKKQSIEIDEAVKKALQAHMGK